MRICVLAGGVGSARFLSGLVRVVDPGDVTVVVNTGDDEEIRGLHVSPDVDTVLYHLAGLTDWERGWGLEGETFLAGERYAELVERAGHTDVDLQEWFSLGDRDLATHMLRTRMLDAGRSLTEATDLLRRALGVGCHILPMTDDRVRTRLLTDAGEDLDFQTYFVRRRHAEPISQVRFEGADGAKPAPGVIDAIATADVVLVPPSNPLLSIAPLLAIAPIRAALATASDRIGVSPIVGGRAIKGPADVLLSSLGHEPSAVGVARVYEGLLDTFVIDDADAAASSDVEALGVRVVTCDTIMDGPEDAARLAKLVVDHAR